MEIYPPVIEERAEYNDYPPPDYDIASFSYPQDYTPPPSAPPPPPPGYGYEGGFARDTNVPDVSITDEWADDNYYGDDGYWDEGDQDQPWLPYTAPDASSKDAQASGSQQQVVIAGLPGMGVYPGVGEITDSYCQIYPRECAIRKGEPFGRGGENGNGTCVGGTGGNCTDTALEGSDGRALEHVDLSGMGLTMLIALMILVGVHFCWDSDGSKAERGDKASDGKSKSKDDKPKPADSKARKDSKGSEDSGKDIKDHNATSGDGARAPRPEPPKDRSKDRSKDSSKDASKDASKESSKESGKDKAKTSGSDSKNRKPPEGRDGKDRESSRRPAGETSSSSKNRETPESERERAKRKEQERKEQERKEQERAAGDRKNKDGERGQTAGTVSGEKRREEERKKKDQPAGATGSGSGTKEREKKDRDRGAETGTSSRPPGGSSGSGSKDRKGEPGASVSGGSGSKDRKDKPEEAPTAGSGSKDRSKDKDRSGGSGGSERPKTGSSSQPGAPSSGSSRKSKTPGEAAVDAAQKKLDDEQKAEKEAKRKAEKEATRANGGQRPATVPETPEVKAAKENRRKAQQELDQAKRAQAAEGGGGASGSSGGGEKDRKKAGEGPGAPATGGTEREQKEAARKAEREARAKAKAEDEAKKQEQRDGKKKKDETPAAGAGAGAGGEDKRTPGQKGADAAVEKRRKERDRAVQKENEAKAGGDAEKIAAARKARQEAQRKYDEAKAKKKEEDDKAAGKSGSGTASAEEQPPSGSSGDPKVRRAERKLNEAREAEEAAKKGGDPAEAAAARQKRKEAEAQLKNANANAEEGEGEGSGGFLSSAPMKLLLPLLILLPLIGLLSRGHIAMPSRGAFSAFTPPSPILPRPVTHVPPRSSSWTASSKPASQIHINNVNSQGGGDTNIGDSSPPEPEPTIVVDTPPNGAPPVGPPVQPLQFHFSGPANPERLFGMVLALILAFAPAIFDSARDWPRRSYILTDYLAPFYHWAIMGLFGILVLFTAEQRYGFSRQYGAAMNSFIAPAMVATAEGTERLVWGTEDLVFGDSRNILGIVMAAGMVALVSMRAPMREDEAPKTEYAAPFVQALYLFGIAIVGMLVWQA